MKISVIIPTYNHARWLPESIESALHQTLKAHEIIVVNDGSTDNTPEVVSRYPVRHIYQQNAGLSAARNRGIRESTGEWIALLDADDYWLPEKLELQAAAIHDEGLCYCATTKFDIEGRTSPGDYHDDVEVKRVLRHRNVIDPSAVLVRRDVITKIGGFNESMPAAEDWEAWLRLSRVCKFVGVPQRLLMYRVTGTGMSSNPEIVLRSMEHIVSAGTADLPPIRRFIESRRMRSVRTSLAAFKYRDLGDHRNSLRYAWRAFKYWPSPFYGKAFKLLLLELRKNLFRVRAGD